MAVASILIIEDSALFRQALAHVLSRGGVRNIRTRGSIVFEKQRRLAGVDCVILDAVTYAGDRRCLIEIIGEISHSTPVIVLGREDSVDDYAELVRAGAMGFVRQTAPARSLNNAIQAVREGRVYFEGAFFRKLLLRLHPAREHSVGTNLTERDRRVLCLISEGRTNKEIGASLGVRERTAKGQVSRLMLKLACSTRSALASFAIAHRIADFAL